jgi:hypothetical protein
MFNNEVGPLCDHGLADPQSEQAAAAAGLISVHAGHAHSTAAAACRG